MPSDHEHRRFFAPSGDSTPTTPLKESKTGLAVRSKATILKRWSVASLDDVLSRELTPPYWSEYVVKSLATLSNNAPLDAARSMLEEQISRRRREETEQSKAINSHPYLTRGDLDAVLLIGGFRQKKSPALGQGSVSTSGPRPREGSNSMTTHNKGDESPTLGSIVVMSISDDSESSSVEGSPEPHEPEAPKHELPAQKTKPNEPVDPKPSLSGRAASPSKQRPSLTPPQRGLTIPTSQNGSRSSSSGAKTQPESHRNTEDKDSRSRAGENQDPESCDIENVILANRDLEDRNLEQRDVDSLHSELRATDKPDLAAVAATRHRAAALELLTQAAAVQPFSHSSGPTHPQRSRTINSRSRDNESRGSTAPSHLSPRFFVESLHAPKPSLFQQRAPNPLQAPKMHQPVPCSDSSSRPVSTALQFPPGASHVLQGPTVAPTPQPPRASHPMPNGTVTISPTTSTTSPPPQPSAQPSRSTQPPLTTSPAVNVTNLAASALHLSDQYFLEPTQLAAPPSQSPRTTESGGSLVAGLPLSRDLDSLQGPPSSDSPRMNPAGATPSSSQHNSPRPGPDGPEKTLSGFHSSPQDARSSSARDPWIGERVVTRIASGAIRQKSVAELLGETRASGNGVTLPSQLTSSPKKTSPILPVAGNTQQQKHHLATTSSGNRASTVTPTCTPVARDSQIGAVPDGNSVLVGRSPAASTSPVPGNNAHRTGSANSGVGDAGGTHGPPTTSTSQRTTTAKLANKTAANPRKRKYSDVINGMHSQIREAELEFEVASALYNQASYRLDVAIQYVTGLGTEVDRTAADYMRMSRLCELEREVMKLAGEYADVLFQPAADRANNKTEGPKGSEAAFVDADADSESGMEHGPNSHGGAAGSSENETGCQPRIEKAAAAFKAFVLAFHSEPTASMEANELAAKRQELQEELALAEAALDDARANESNKRTILEQKQREMATLQDARQKSSRLARPL